MGGDEADGGDLDLNDLRPGMRQSDAFIALDGDKLTGVDRVCLAPYKIALVRADRICQDTELHDFARSRFFKRNN